jgi:hypothetical protein
LIQSANGPRSGGGIVCRFNPPIVRRNLDGRGIHREYAGQKKVGSVRGDGVSGSAFASFLLAI